MLGLFSLNIAPLFRKNVFGELFPCHIHILLDLSGAMWVLLHNFSPRLHNFDRSIAPLLDWRFTQDVESGSAKYLV
jgi:hypothetical protein